MSVPDPRDEDEKERYVTRQLWWALLGLVLFALALLFGWGGAEAASSMSRESPPAAPVAHRSRAPVGVCGWTAAAPAPPLRLDSPRTRGPLSTS